MKLPNGPKTPPIVQTLQWMAHPLEFLDECAQRYGDFFTVRRNNHRPVVYFSHPQAMQEIFTTNPQLFDSGLSNRLLQILLGQHSLSLNSLDAKRHQRQRRLLMPAFHGERMRVYGQIMGYIAEQVISQQSIGQPFSVRSSMQEISMRVILSAVFGLHGGQRFDQLRQLLSSLLDSISSPLNSSLIFFRSLQRDFGVWSPWGRFLRQKQQIDQLLYAEIQQRREQFDPSRTDILTLLMSARDEAGEPMTDVELRDQLMTLLLAGHETTATALAWAFYWIDQLPEVRDKLLRELNTLPPDSDPRTIARLPYLTAVCQETLRIYPIALIASPRVVKSPFQLMGYEFEPGTKLVPCIYLTHQRPELYPEPKRFKPERFLEHQFSLYEYLPFGGGNRGCIGMAFAQFEMKLVLAKILSRFQLALVDSHPVKPVRRGFTLAPPENMRMIITSRQPQKQVEKVLVAC
ncbi:cytochrome P450 [Coleofasciculus sp.]|uniref:cytochrome P450 n=1 Tax=Coleofasciculus sp. TaxID=3100458 RepID=UPI003A2A82DB